jgi:hypothetical protein
MTAARASVNPVAASGSSAVVSGIVGLVSVASASLGLISPGAVAG